MLVILLGVVLSLLWCWAGWYYLEMVIGFENLLLFLPHEIGQFAVGFFTPLFLLWILITLVQLVRRMGPLPAMSSEGGGGTDREPKLAARKNMTSPIEKHAKPQQAAPKPQSSKASLPGTDAQKAETRLPTPRSEAAAKPGEKQPSGKPAAAAGEGVSRAQASATVKTTDKAGKTTLRKVEHSAVSGSGPAKAIAKAVGRDASQDAESFEARGENRGTPPKRPAHAPPLATPEPQPEAKLPPKRRQDSKTPEQQLDAEDGASGIPAGPLPPKRPVEENVATLPRNTGGTLPPKNPRSLSGNFAEAQRHTLKELNAIAMDTAALICEAEAYHASREALNDGQDDSIFQLLRNELESDGRKALERLSQGDNAILLETYQGKFESLLQAAAQEPDGETLRAQLQTSAPGRLYATIESKL